MKSVIAQEWALRLRRAAPDAQLAMLRTLAAILAGPARSDALLIVADGLAEGAAEMRIEGRLGLCTTLQQLAGVLRDEAPRRA